MNSSSTPTQRLVRHALTLAMSVWFIAAGWLLLKPLVRPSIAEAAVATTAPWTTKAIEEIAVGDLVLARDEHGTALGWKPVKEVYRRTSYHLRHLTFRDAAGHEQTFETTDEHPFWSVTVRKFVNAGDLKAGDRVVSVPQHTSSGQTPVAVDPAQVQTLTATHRDEHPAGITVHNFQVEDFHTYFVAARGATGPPVLVHNANKNYDDFDDVVDNLKSTNALRSHNEAVGSLCDKYGIKDMAKRRRVNDAITNQNYTLKEIEEIIQSMFGVGN